MKSILADTGPLYAAYDPSDTYHTQAIVELECLANQEVIVLIAYPVFLEAHSLILKRLGTSIGFRYIQEISAGADLLQPTIEDYRTATQLIQQYHDQAITLFDATTTAISQRLELAVWTYDFHFDVMKTRVWR